MFPNETIVDSVCIRCCETWNDNALGNTLNSEAAPAIRQGRAGCVSAFCCTSIDTIAYIQEQSDRTGIPLRWWIVSPCFTLHMVFRCFQPWSISNCCRSSVVMIRWILANYLQRCAIIWYEVSSNLGPWFWRAGLLSCREVFSLVQDSGSSQRLDYFKLQDRTIFLGKWTRGRCW